MENYERYVGAVLDNRYRIEKVIGIGGMAVVFKADDTLMRRSVAVKILKDEIAKDEQSVKRFINESKAVSMLSHPNIVNIYDVSMKGAEKYIVMEYIEGITLKNYMTKKGTLSLREIIGYTEQILRALEHAHAKGIVHRDIKPQNIMLLRNGVVKVTDFGIAKLPNAETVTMTDKAIGTVFYISPEQASGKDIDARSDIYSLGVMMYEMATAKLPFTADSPVSVALMHINEEAPVPKDVNENMPAGLSQIITRAMEKDPVMRYQSTTQMLRQLIQLKENPQVQFKAPKKPTPPGEKKGKKERRQSRSMFPIIMGVVIPFFIIAAISAIVIVSQLFSNTDDLTETITVREFVGQSYTDEMQLFFSSSDYYKVTVEYVYDDTAEVGRIISQTPESGETRKVKKGERYCELTLVVSKGTKYAEMPNLIAINHREAKFRLQKIGVELNIVMENQVNSVYEAGAVISTNPPAGETLEGGDTVTIYVSYGPTPEKIEMPNFVGMNEEEALRAIIGARLNIGTVTYEASGKAEGTVLTQSVVAGDEVFIFATVNFTVSGGKDYGKTVTTETETESEILTEDTTDVTDTGVSETEPGEDTLVTEESDTTVTDTDITPDTEAPDDTEEPVDDTTDIVTDEPQTTGPDTDAIPVGEEDDLL